MQLSVAGVTVRVAGRAIVDDATLTVPAGSFVAVVGPNGSGKSTLLRTIYRAMRPTAGRVTVGEVDVWASPPRASAAARAVVTQHQTTAPGLLVRDVVATGRQVHQRWYRPDSTTDRRAVDEALARCGVDALAARSFASLSGGERQRVLLARALAQGAPCVLLDEPTNHLDPRARHEVLGLLDSLPLTRLVVLHDLDHAVAHADLLVVLHEGRVRAVGEPTSVLTAELAAEVFGVRAEVVAHPLTGRPHLVTAALVPEPT